MLGLMYPQSLLLLRSTMQQQYWYFGIRRKVSVVDATGRTRNVHQAIWAPTVYDTADKAAAAAAKAMVTRPGVSFFIQGFDRKLVIQPDGICTGYEGLPEGIKGE